MLPAIGTSRPSCANSCYQATVIDQVIGFDEGASSAAFISAVILTWPPTASQFARPLPKDFQAHPAGTRVGAWPLLRLITMARHGIVPAFARCTEFLARAASLATTAQPGMSG